jgi:hypothetical protein
MKNLNIGDMIQLKGFYWKVAMLNGPNKEPILDGPFPDKECSGFVSDEHLPSATHHQ